MTLKLQQFSVENLNNAEMIRENDVTRKFQMDTVLYSDRLYIFCVTTGNIIEYLLYMDLESRLYQQGKSDSDADGKILVLSAFEGPFTRNSDTSGITNN